MSFSSRPNPFFVRTSPNFWFPYLRTVRWVTFWNMHESKDRWLIVYNHWSLLVVNLWDTTVLIEFCVSMVWGDPINKWSYPLSACRCRMSSWALGRKSSVESEYINYCTIANVLNSPIGGQTRFQLINCIKVFVRVVSTTFGRTVDSFPSETLLIFHSIFYSIVRQTCPYVV